MNNRRMMLMILCVISSPLMSMKKSTTIGTAGELKILALSVNPENYEKTLKKHVVNSEVVTSSVNILLQGKQIPDGANKHVETTSEYNKELYNKQILQIMHDYYAQEHGLQLSISDEVKVALYRYLTQEISEKEQELKTLRETQSHWGQVAFVGGGLAVGCAIVDLIIGLTLGLASSLY